jgi:hypothetical protein
LASRARRRIQDAAPIPGHELSRQRAIVDAFLTAFTVIGTKIAAIDIIDNPDRIAEADLTILDRGHPTADEGVVSNSAGPAWSAIRTSAGRLHRRAPVPASPVPGPSPVR